MKQSTIKNSLLEVFVNLFAVHTHLTIGKYGLNN